MYSINVEDFPELSGWSKEVTEGYYSQPYRQYRKVTYKCVLNKTSSAVTVEFDIFPWRTWKDGVWVTSSICYKGIFDAYRDWSILKDPSGIVDKISKLILPYLQKESDKLQKESDELRSFVESVEKFTQGA